MRLSQSGGEHSSQIGRERGISQGDLRRGQGRRKDSRDQANHG